MAKCGYIAGDDYPARIRRGENVFCDKPVVRGSFCAEHAEKCLAGKPKPKSRAYNHGTQRFGSMEKR